MSLVEIFEIIEFIGLGSRSFEEGSEALKQIVLCGKNSTSKNDGDNYIALCFSTSHPTTDEYAFEIKVNIKTVNKKKCLVHVALVRLELHQSCLLLALYSI